ncbi:NUDIX hydrolase, partial [Liquorilactobacillus ghanensis]
MEATHKLIAHVLIPVQDSFILIKRTTVKRGKKNVFPSFWDIPGGLVERGETPREAAVRECREEIGLQINIRDIIFEDSEIDKQKKLVFTRLVYMAKPLKKDMLNKISLDLEEHSDINLFHSFDTWENSEKLVPYVIKILRKNMLK